MVIPPQIQKLFNDRLADRGRFPNPATAELTKIEKKALKAEIKRIYPTLTGTSWEMPSDTRPEKPDKSGSYRSKLDTFVKRRWMKAKTDYGVENAMSSKYHKEYKEERATEKRALLDQQIRDNPNPDGRLTSDQIPGVTIQALIKKHDRLDGMSILYVLMNAVELGVMVYIGCHGNKDTINTEWLRWATKQTGVGNNGKRCDPVIMRPNSGRFGKPTLRDKFKFICIPLYKSNQLGNCTDVERKMHTVLQEIPYPYCGWIQRGSGENYEGKTGKGVVFAAVSFGAAIDAIKDGTMIFRKLKGKFSDMKFPANFRQKIPQKLFAALEREPLQEMDRNVLQDSRPVATNFSSPLKKKRKKKIDSSSNSSSDEDSSSDSDSSFDDENDKKIQEMGLWNAANANTSFSSRHMVDVNSSNDKNDEMKPSAKRKATTSSSSHSKSLDNDVSMLFSSDDDDNDYDKKYKKEPRALKKPTKRKATTSRRKVLDYSSSSDDNDYDKKYKKEPRALKKPTKRKATTSSSSHSKSLDNDVSMLFSSDDDDNDYDKKYKKEPRALKKPTKRKATTSCRKVLDYSSSSDDNDYDKKYKKEPRALKKPTKRKATTSSSSHSKSLDNDVSMLFSSDDDDNDYDKKYKKEPRALKKPTKRKATTSCHKVLDYSSSSDDNDNDNDYDKKYKKEPSALKKPTKRKATTSRRKVLDYSSSSDDEDNGYDKKYKKEPRALKKKRASKNAYSSFSSCSKTSSKDDEEKKPALKKAPKKKRGRPTNYESQRNIDTTQMMTMESYFSTKPKKPTLTSPNSTDDLEEEE
ncbi:predicted protein [Chaetoceros tenuissimus]|uniref:Elongation factor 1 beta central acidic region eukaryote domain-containing protein n=1 Tax=Chaetoceros tenuissimus TaxID=426638 RepID=A0AAD3H1E5_9STRA|nr:predicted protein [Chaetoceros tenuissimus]